jgi:hypothetical protein
MKFQDLFVPRWQHSNPEVRRMAVMKLKDTRLLHQILDKDDDEQVRLAVKDRLTEIEAVQVSVEL